MTYTGHIPVIDCQTSQSSWLDHVLWADAWRSLTRRRWGCDVCGTRTFHRANVRKAQAWNKRVDAENRARWRHR